MTTIEVYDRIFCWLWLYQNAAKGSLWSRSVLDFNSGIGCHWQREMLSAVSGMNVPDDVKDTSIEGDLRLAINLAMLGDNQLIGQIASLLKKVNSAIANRILHGVISVN